jgi:hypothetical protein
MTSIRLSETIVLSAILVLGSWACSNTSGGGAGSGGTQSPPSDTGGSTSGPTGSGGAGAGGMASGGGSSGGPGSGGATIPAASGGAIARGGASNSYPQQGGAGGLIPRTGGSGGRIGRPDASPGTGGAGAGGSTIDGGPAPGGDCKIGAWPTADPSKAGPYKTVTENDVGPTAGDAGDAGVAPRFTMFRPQNLTEVELCHPVITWGNGTGSTPNLYGTLLKNFASHGFVVIASNNTNVARGNPAPMVVGVTWVLEQNDDPTSVLYHRIDTTHIGATGHSQGAMATSSASGDSHITTSIPIEGASAQRNLHGPAMFFCGGQDTLVGCNGATSALAAVTTLPAMFAQLNAVDHGSWMSRGSTLSAADTAFTAWMRVHLMGDTELRPWFYGASCKLCTDSAWTIDRKNMDQ